MKLLKGNVAILLMLAAFTATSQNSQPRVGGLFNPRLRQTPAGANQLSAGAANPAAGASKASEKNKVESGGRSIEFNAAPLELVFKVYGELVGKTILKDPSTPSVQITLQPLPGQELSNAEKIEAIETVLEMNGVHIQPFSDKFALAIPRDQARKKGIVINMDQDAELRDSNNVVSYMLQFKNISTEEAQKALEGLKSDKGVLNVYERINSILITDTEMNVNRMRELAKAIDVQSPVNENVFVRQIKYASAEEIKVALEAIVQESQKELEKQGKRPNNSRTYNQQQPRMGLLGRRLNQQQPQPAENSSQVTSVSDADRGMIRGRVLILADERSNKLIVVTATPNMNFFDRVIEQLDIETTPDTVVKVYRLKYADAEDVSDMINDLIGNAASSKSSGKQNQNQASRSGTNGNLTRSTTAGSTAKRSVNKRSGEAKAGELSKDNTTVLADKRINGLVVMTQKELVPVVESIIEAMDVKLSQVLIETVIIEVALGDDISTGIDWVHGMHKKNGSYQQALGGGGGSASPVSGLTNGVSLLKTAASVLPGTFVPGSAGLNYAVFSKNLDLGAVIKASKGDSNAKYLASPIVMTVDNKEATIEATQMRYLLKGYTSTSSYYGTATPDYQQKEIGLTVKVTPKINPNGTVMLSVEEEYSQVGEDQQIEATVGSGTGGQATSKVNVPTTITRKMAADISLENMQTVVLGGLTETSVKESESGIPILKDIPWIGKYLFGSTTSSEARKELLVFMTPYVINDGSEAEAEAIRRKATLIDSRAWDDHGWSRSKLADPVSTKERLRRQKDEWKKQDEEFKSLKELEKAKQERVKELNRRAAKEAEERAERDVKLREENAELLKIIQGEMNSSKGEAK